MATTTAERRRELAHRTAGGIDVSLFWSKPTNRLTVEIADARLGVTLQFDVDRRAALDAFYHPYAYIRVADAETVAAEPHGWSGVGERAALED